MATETRDGRLYLDGKELTTGDTVDWRGPSGEWLRLRVLVSSDGERVDVSTVVESGDSSADTVVDVDTADLRWPAPLPPYDIDS